MTKPEDLPPMQYRFLGRTGLQVSVISLGGWLTYGGHVDKEGTFACMEAAYNCGVNFFDTAEAYAGGESEVVMGQAIKHFGWNRNDLVISTKLYWGGKFGKNPINNTGLSRKHIIEGMNQSLARLDLEYVDIVYAHRADRRTPMEETVRAFNHLIDTGKAFYWGTSEWSADEITSAWRVADRLGLIGPVVEQPQYNMLERQRWRANSPISTARLASASPSSPSQAGHPLRKTVDFVAGFWKTTGKEKWDGVVEQVNRLAPIAEKLGTKLSGLALAWTMKHSNLSSAIMGASSVEQVYENVRALEVIDKLTPEIMAEIDEILQNKPPRSLLGSKSGSKNTHQPNEMTSLPNYKYGHFLVTSPSPFVAHVEINQPHKLNSFHRDMWLEFGDIFAKLSHDPEVRAVVLSGSGDRAFTAGLDVKAAAGEGPITASEVQDCISQMDKCEKPVICILHGVSLGLAIDIAVCADIRIAAEGTQLAVKEVDVGLAADIGSLARLPKVVGNSSWVKEVCLTARTFSPQEALAVGFVSQVHPNKQAAVEAGLKMAASIAGKSPVAVQGTKEILNHARDHSIEENLRYTAVWNSAMVLSDDFKKAILAGLTKKKPTFEKL
ncbi:unnamed protein product [Parascedosporium putredinis]|uniref:NADP-dependent oxidoreductase domain-containing protein n=1 Tax=Parascedosporium putredinis TaxID=1442378 RepID=A0A9P1H4L9_9PEZI|nr:unnamed protein product [Parascedosporium putredinis]CAI7995673.1 unnamed protein product [Parascedosporium putredinis]